VATRPLVEAGPVSLTPQAEVSLSFAGDRVSGFGGCNSFGGPIISDGEQLSLGPLQATRRACLESAVMNQETRFFQALQSVSGIGILLELWF
jgi:heat shock protein HslJ